MRECEIVVQHNTENCDTESVLPEEKNSSIYETIKKIKSTTRTRNFLLSLGAVLIILLLVFAIISLIITLSVTRSSCSTVSPTLVVPTLQNSLLKHSQEYQLKLDVEQWTNRDEMLRIWNQAVMELNPTFNLTGRKIKEVIWEEYKLDATECKSDATFRVRDYVAKGKTTIDIKENAEDDEEKACSYPFWPSSKLLEKSSQKCEEDIHKCFRKFSRKTKVEFRNITSFHTCLDLVTVYPWAFGSLDMYHLENKLLIEKNRSPWWVASLSGRIDDTKFGIEFTLEYDTMEEALNPTHPPKSGEWSIRIFTRQSGFSTDWDEKIVSETNKLWEEMGARFGGPDFVPCE